LFALKNQKARWQTPRAFAFEGPHMAIITVRSNAVEIETNSMRIARDVPFAAVKALTRTAKLGQEAVRAEMRAVFDRPTPYTLASTFIRPATKDRPVSSVYLKDDTSKGTPAERYLAAQIEGTTRRHKRMEVALQRIGVLPQGWYVVPGKAARLDGYGNWSRGQIVQVLAYFQAFGEGGYRANTTAAGRAKRAKGTRSKRGITYFAVLPGRRASRSLQPGIYLQTRFAFGSALQPIAIFVEAASYRRRLHFHATVERTVVTHFGEELRRAMAEQRV
jgi:hypothetical protein